MLVIAIDGRLRIDLQGVPARQLYSPVKEVVDGAGWTAKEAADQIRSIQA